MRINLCSMPTPTMKHYNSLIMCDTSKGTPCLLPVCRFAFAVCLLTLKTNSNLHIYCKHSSCHIYCK